MALINNPNSWNGGTAVFNAAPITETYLKLAAHREAKNAALDQYHEKQLERVDRDGVRDNDADQFQKKVNDWNQHWQENKDLIRKGNIRAQIDNDKLYGDLMGFVKQSKERTDLNKAAMPVGMGLKNKMGTTPDQFHADIAANDLPIGAPGSKKINLNPYVNEPDDWDVEKGMKAYDRIPRVPLQPIIGETDPKTGKRIITQTEGYDTNGKANVAAIAGSEFQNDRSFNKAVQTAVANPESKQMLEQVYQDQMGKKPEHPEEYATAFALSKMAPKVTQKIEDDKQFMEKQKNDQAIAMEKMRQTGRIGLQALRANNQKELIDYRQKLKGATAEQKENVLNTTFDSIEEEAHKKGRMDTVANGKKVGEFYVAPVPNTIKGQLGLGTGKEKEYPDHIAFMPDNNVKVVFFKKKEGDKIPGDHIDNDKSYTITRDQFKAMIGKSLFGVKTTSGADYGEDYKSDEDDNDEGGVPLPTVKPSTKKKIPGF